MKKTMAIVLSMVLAMGALGGCGGSGGGSSSSSSGSAAASGSGSSSSVGSQADPEAKKDPVTLSVVTAFAGENTNTQNYQDAIKAWQDETGNKVNDASAASDETFKARVQADFETGAEPDVLFYFNGVDSNAFVEAGKVVSIDEIRQVYPDYASNMKDGMLGASPVDGKNYSIPVNGYWEGLFVNKKVMEAAGAEIPGPNTTWDEFLATCQKIKDAGYTPIAASLAQVPHYWFEYCIYNYDTPATHSILPDAAGDERATSWAGGLGDIKDMYEKGFFPENTLSALDDDTFQMFIDGKAAFLVDGSWKSGAIENKFAPGEGQAPDPEKVKDFTVTYVPGKNERKTTDIIGGLSMGYYITRKAWDDPNKRDTVVEFINYMTTDEMVSKFAGISASALKNGVTVDESTLTSLAKDGLAMVKGATAMTSAVQDYISPQCRVPVFDGMPTIVSGQKTPEDAVAECLKLIEEEKAEKAAA